MTTGTRVRVPAPLAAWADGDRTIRVTAETVGEALREIARISPEAATILFGRNGSLRASLAVFVNGVDARTLSGERTPIRSEDQVTILSALPGG